jgi:hypothetical protein
MSASGAAPALASGVAALAIIALVVVVVLFAVPGKNGGAAAAATASLGQGENGGEAPPAPADQPPSATPPLPGLLSSAFPGAPYYRDPRDADPYWWPRPLWGRDRYNRDPVCYGDPACRDAYFRDWPWARRPYGGKPGPSQPSSAPQPPINVTVTAPSTSTATNTVTLPPPPPPPPAPLPPSEPEPAPEPILEPEAAPVDIAGGEEESAGAVRASVRATRTGSLAARLKRAAGKVARAVAKEGAASQQAQQHQQPAGACRSCRLGATTPAPSYEAVFPPTMDRSAYAL